MLLARMPPPTLSGCLRADDGHTGAKQVMIWSVPLPLVGIVTLFLPLEENTR